MSLASTLAKVCGFFVFIASLSLLIDLSFSISTSKAFAVVFPLTRQNNVIDIAVFIVFFAKCYWLKVRYVRTRVKRILFGKKILRPSICEKFPCHTDLPCNQP